MSHLAYLGEIIDTVLYTVEDLFDLNDHLLDDPMVPERVDKSIALLESIEDLRRTVIRLERLKSRMEGERDGNAGQNEGP